MAYLIFGFALGTLIYWIIARYDKQHTAWVKPRYILWLSGLLFGVFVYLEWPVLKTLFS